MWMVLPVIIIMFVKSRANLPVLEVPSFYNMQVSVLASIRQALEWLMKSCIVWIVVRILELIHAPKSQLRGWVVLSDTESNQD